VTALGELAPRYGFGFVDGWHKVGRKLWPGVLAAAYLASYFAGGGPQDVDHGERARWRPTAARRVRRTRLDVANGLHDAESETARRLWAAREGLCEFPRLDLRDWLMAAAMLSRRRIE
jgi:hypothetical protein